MCKRMMKVNEKFPYELLHHHHQFLTPSFLAAMGMDKLSPLPSVICFSLSFSPSDVMSSFVVYIYIYMNCYVHTVNELK